MKEVVVDSIIVPVNATDIAVEPGSATPMRIVATLEDTEHVN